MTQEEREHKILLQQAKYHALRQQATDIHGAKNDDASARQIGGEHYVNFEIQPAEFCQRNKLPWCESNVIKYVCRHRHKNGRQDIEKAIHYLQLILEWEYK